MLFLLSLVMAEPLTLEQALLQAQAHAPEARMAAARTAEAQANRAAALAPLLPQVSASGQYQHWDEGIEIPNFLEPGGDPIVVQAQDSLAANFSASQVIFSPAAFGRFGAANAAAQGAEASAAGAEADLRWRVTQLWVGARSALEFLQVARRLEEATKTHRGVAEAALAVGTATPLAVARATLAEQEARRRTIEAERNLADLEGQLSLLTGGEVQELADFPPLPQDNAETAQQDAKDRPELRTADASVRAAQAGEWTVIGDWVPTVSAIGAVRISNSPGFSGSPTTWYLGLSANLPLVDGGLRFADARRVQAQQEQASANLERLQDSTEEEIRAALRAEKAAEATLLVTRQAETLAEDTYRSTVAANVAGTASPVEVEDAQNAWLTASVDRIRAQGAIVLAHAQIQLLSGR